MKQNTTTIRITEDTKKELDKLKVARHVVYSYNELIKHELIPAYLELEKFKLYAEANKPYRTKPY